MTRIVHETLYIYLHTNQKTPLLMFVSPTWTFTVYNYYA